MGDSVTEWKVSVIPYKLEKCLKILLQITAKI